MIRIIIHSFPHELKQYRRVINKLITNKTNVIIESCLNLNKNITHYTDSEIYLVQKFRDINKTSTIKIEETITSNTLFCGVNEHRRHCINKSSVDDLLIFLDTDIHFNEQLLDQIIESSNDLLRSNKYFILTPQTVRLWDTSWDCIVNEKFKNKNLNYHKEINIRELVKSTYGSINIEKNKKFKWAGGWFTSITANLAKLINIPVSFIGYGPDDTYMMYCCNYLKKKQIEVTQYIQTGYIVCEDVELNYTSFFKNPNLFRKRCDSILNKEYFIFKKKIDSYIYGNEDT